MEAFWETLLLFGGCILGVYVAFVAIAVILDP